ncbi:DUF2461 domain-containing protein [Hymenobacter tibetensis]|uniref:DUF2461 domain-containing protein n=1 Tax=Hymenobacter tibetensis TaxID=497967 RepID=A0ABY4CUJ5_9BACT|nr:DUF2461 domain-containing protein [Hymenobacter tibetensis]UOG73940.1 DUF2461 domain-containing protein [Hymenobacter tibetensis]
MNTPLLFDFLTELREHNDRDWFQARKATYDQLRLEFEAAVGRWLKQLATHDSTLVGLEPKKCIFRIYRDVRFSRDKRPYKTHFSAYFSGGGKSGNGPGYYVQLGPNGQTLLAGGLYEPEKEQLARIRQEIDYNGDALHRLLQAPGFRKYFTEVGGDKLKKAPTGYPVDHPEIELLKYKSFVVSHQVPDATARHLDLDTYVPAAFRAMQPFCEYLQEAIEG